MRIPAREVLFTGQDRCPEFDLCKEPLPEELNILLCLLDGAERRLHLQAQINAASDVRSEKRDPSDPPSEKH
jgi:hypothetical protein